MRSITPTFDIHCVTKWSKFDTTWTGVRVRDLFDRAGVRPEATHVMEHAEFGYTTNIPLADITTDDAIIAFAFDGGPIEDEHGGPVRVVDAPPVLLEVGQVGAVAGTASPVTRLASGSRTATTCTATRSASNASPTTDASACDFYARAGSRRDGAVGPAVLGAGFRDRRVDVAGEQDPGVDGGVCGARESGDVAPPRRRRASRASPHRTDGSSPTTCCRCPRRAGSRCSGRPARRPGGAGPRRRRCRARRARPSAARRRTRSAVGVGGGSPPPTQRLR